MRLQSLRSASAGAEEKNSEIAAAGSARMVRAVCRRILALKRRLIIGDDGFARVTSKSAHFQISSLVDQRAGTLVGEQFEQHGVRRLAIDDHDALHALDR